MKKYLFNKILIVFTFLYGFHCSSEQAIKDKDSDIVTIVSPAYDYSFKALFSKPEILINFLNSLYYPSAQENDLKIRKVKVYDNFEFSASKKWKSIYFDVACECTAYAKNTEKLRSGEAKENYKKTIFDVEMQREVDSNYRKRSVYYGCTIFSKELTQGKGYDSLKPAKIVSFLKDPLDSTKGVIFHSLLVDKVYKEKEGKLYVEYVEQDPLLEFTYIQLSLFDRTAKLNTNLDSWLSLMSIEKSDSSFGKLVNDNSETFIPLYNISSSKYINIKPAIDELARIAEDHFSDYAGSFLKEIMDEAQMIDKNAKIEQERLEKEEALQREAAEREAKELAQKKAEEERLEKEKFQKQLEEEKRKNEEFIKQLEELQKRKLGQVTPEPEQDSVNLKMARKEDQLKDQPENKLEDSE